MQGFRYMPLPELCSHKRVVLSSWNRLICQQYDVLVLLRVVVSFPCAACVQLGAHGGAGNAARVAGERRSSALIAQGSQSVWQSLGAQASEPMQVNVDFDGALHCLWVSLHSAHVFCVCLWVLQCRPMEQKMQRKLCGQFALPTAQLPAGVISNVKYVLGRELFGVFHAGRGSEQQVAKERFLAKQAHPGQRLTLILQLWPRNW